VFWWGYIERETAIFYGYYWYVVCLGTSCDFEGCRSPDLAYPHQIQYNIIRKNTGVIISTIEKLFNTIMNGRNDRNIKFRDLQKLLEYLGFECIIRGDHFIYYYADFPEIINLQPNGHMAKPYQVKQIRNFFLKYQIGV